MAFTGVNRANVAVTDTFDTWRIRTNEINTSLNQATSANTADKIVWRDDAGSANLNILNANTTILTHTGSSDSALSVVSGVAAQSDGTYASIKTTGGIYATLSSKFAADLTIGTNLSVEGNSTLGNAATDTLTFTGRVATGTDLLPIASNSSDLGSSALQFANTHFQKQTMVGSGTEGGNTLGITASAASNVAVGVINNSLTTGGLLSLSSSSTTTNPRNLALITQSGDVTTSGDTTGLKLAMTSGRGIFIDSDDTDGEEAFQIDSEQQTTNAVTIDAATTTATGAHFNFAGLTTGSGVEISSASASMSTAGALLELNQSHALSSAANVATFSVVTAGNGAYGVKVNSTHATSNASLRIDSSTTTKNISSHSCKQFSRYFYSRTIW